MSDSLFPANGGFTRLELTVVLGAIGLLAIVFFPCSGLALSRESGRQAQCRNNLRQLAQAFFMYGNDHQDAFPAPAAKRALGPQTEDWVFWQPVGGGTPPRTRPLGLSRIGPFVPAFSAHSLRCPTDTAALEREALMRSAGIEGYPYSYSLNSHSEDGMATYISSGRITIRVNTYSKTVDPARKIMLVEERSSNSDGPPAGAGTFIDDGRWVPPGNALTVRHEGKANVAFADGGVDTVARGFAQQFEHFDPLR